MLRPLGEESVPVFFTLHHEPENDAGPPGMQPADYVAMQRRAIGLAAELAPQVTIVPVLQHWTFDPLRERRDPAAWIVPEASVIGLDIYNPWSPTNGKEWRSFGSKADEVIAWFGDTPLAIGEYGCRDDPREPRPRRRVAARRRGLRAGAQLRLDVLLQLRRGLARRHVGAPGRDRAAFAELLASDWVARPA